MILLLFPNQLYDHSLVKSTKHVYLIEEPLFFFEKTLRPLKYHKAKLAYLVGCMAEYAHKYKHITYVPFKDIDAFYAKIKTEKDVKMFDPTDHMVLQKYKGITPYIAILPSPNFMMKVEDLQAFHKPDAKRILHSQFFDFVKGRLDILKDQPSTDKDNRVSIPASLDGKMRPAPRYHSPHHKQAIAYVESMWSANPGTYEGLTLWPTNHQQATKHLTHFLNTRFESYGTYQDAIHPSEQFMYHSTISPCLNAGLLSPKQVLDAVLKHARSHKIPMNSLEGFVRQLIGWREYMRYLYIFHHDAYMKHPIPQSKSKRIKDWKAWHEGSTGFHIVDTEIKKCLGSAGGYAHHIIRLMVFLNIFLLLRIHPEDIYKWFMEVCAIDAYDWVMRPNIYCMGYFYPKAMSKQYISTSNYIVNMSGRRYKRDPEWDELFHDYVRELRPHAYLRNLKK